MNEEPRPPRFLRDKKFQNLRDEAEGLLGKLSDLPELQVKLDLLVNHIREDTLKRLERSSETLSRIEGTIELLRRVNPPPRDAVRMLISTANHIQVELRTVRFGLVSLLKSLNEIDEE